MKKIFVIFIAWCSLNAFTYYTEPIPNSCGGPEEDMFVAVFTPNQYECFSGEFLPANTLGCRTCPIDYSCTGGVFNFKKNENQGLNNPNLFVNNLTNTCAANAPHEIIAIFEPNSHTCSAGYYLPAGVDVCTICPANNICSGGTYTFNETIDQGIEPCATGYSSTAGSSSCTANTISITWADASAEDIAANDAGSVTYGGDIRTPRKAVHKPGKIFTGWTFNTPQ